MSTDPIHNSGIPPTSPTPQPDRDKPMVGANEETQPRPFSLPPSPPDKSGAEAAASQKTEKPTPMEVARQSEQDQQKPEWTKEQMQSHLQLLQDQFASAQTKLQSPQSKNLTTEHFNALSRLVDKLNPDMQAIAENSKSQFASPEKTQGESVLSFVSRWINGSQQTLSSALDYVNTVQKPDPASYLKLQFAVQRATQRGELFASIIGSSVSGIKTIMSTQLG